MEIFKYSKQYKYHIAQKGVTKMNGKGFAISDALKKVLIIMGVLVALGVSSLIALVVLGVIGGSVTDGTITSMHTTANESLNSTLTTIIGWITTALSVVGFALGLLTVVIIFMVFKDWISAGKGRSGGSSH